MGSPLRSGRSRPPAADRVALKWSGSGAPDLEVNGPPPGVDLLGSRETGFLVLGALDSLLQWLEELGDVAGAAAHAVRHGAGLATHQRWKIRDGALELGGSTRLASAVNITDDSFYAGSQVMGEEAVKVALERAAAGGADLIDIGGESTRPGADPVSTELQIERVVPAIEAAIMTGLPVSVDTTRSAVAREALSAGAVIINDVSAGIDDPEMLGLAAERGAGLVLMHRQGASATMQEDPRYDDLCGEIFTFLATRARAAEAAGVDPANIVVDPGLGFGKRRQHNFELYRRMAEFHALGYPLLVGPSRKRHTSGPSDRPAEDRLMATAAACSMLAAQGVQILRVHDVAEMRKALDTADEIRGAIVEDRAS
jgi:dihydropteroate synthase